MTSAWASVELELGCGHSVVSTPSRLRERVPISCPRCGRSHSYDPDVLARDIGVRFTTATKGFLRRAEKPYFDF